MSKTTPCTPKTPFWLWAWTTPAASTTSHVNHRSEQIEDPTPCNRVSFVVTDSVSSRSQNDRSALTLAEVDEDLNQTGRQVSQEINSASAPNIETNFRPYASSMSGGNLTYKSHFDEFRLKSSFTFPKDHASGHSPFAGRSARSAVNCSMTSLPSPVFPVRVSPSKSEMSAASSLVPNSGDILLQRVQSGLQSIGQMISGSLRSTFAGANDSRTVVAPHGSQDRQPDRPLADYGFSFAPAGLLFPYHLGVAKFLLDHNLVNDNVPVSGSSAGALTACVLGLNLDYRRALLAMYSLQDDIGREGARGRLRKSLTQELSRIIPPGAHDVLNNRPAPVEIAYTLALTLRGKFINHFHSTDDLIEVVCASCNIPGYFSKWPLVRCRGSLAMDGYFSVSRASFGCPTIKCAKRTIRVLPFSASTVQVAACDRDCISPDLAKFDQIFAREGMLLELQEYLRDNPAPTRAELLETCPEGYEHLIHDGRPPNKSWAASAMGFYKKITLRPVEGSEQERDTTSTYNAGLGSSTSSSLFVPSGKRRFSSESQSTVLDSGGDKQWQPRRQSMTVPAYHPQSARDNKRRTSSGQKNKRRFSFPMSSMCGKTQDERNNALPSVPQVEANYEPLHPGDSVADVELQVPVLRFSVGTLLHYALRPTESDEILRELFDLGRADAFRWWKLQSMPNLGRKRGSISRSRMS